MASKLRAPYHDSFHVLIIQLLLLQVPLLSCTAAQVNPPTLHAQSEVLQVLVPNPTRFGKFVDCSNGPTAIKGFSIDVFKDALSILIPKANWTDVNYTCFDSRPSHPYDILINELQSSESSSFYDAVVGDITISASRIGKASFTQPYLDSGIVLLTPAADVSRHFPGVFLAPFTSSAWCIVIGSITLTGVALLLIESNEDQNIQRSLSKSEYLRFSFRFVTSNLVFFRQESCKSPVSKFVMIAWTIFILLVGSSYTASLSAVLTVKKLSSDINSIDDLKSKNLTVGYQSKLVKDYLELRYGITKLVQLYEKDDFANGLNTRQVAAIVEESPYVNLFLADQPASKCKFLVSSKLTAEGFGFAFRDEILSSAFSVAILNLSESGELQRIQEGWKLTDFQCPSQIQSTQLDLNSSLGLFVLLGSAMLICILIILLKKIIIPYFGRARARLRENQQQDAVDAF